MSAHPQAAPNGQVVLAARNVAKSYGSVHALKGVNLYFNVYNRDAGENMAFLNADGEEIEGFIWMTPDEREKHRARVEKKQAAEELSRERERVRLATQARIQAAREKDRAKREAKKAAAKAAKEGSS